MDKGLQPQRLNLDKLTNCPSLGDCVSPVHVMRPTSSVLGVPSHARMSASTRISAINETLGITYWLETTIWRQIDL